MPKKRSSKSQDMNQIAADILEEAVGEPAPITPAGKKNPAAAKLGRVHDPKVGAVRTKPGNGKGLSPKKQKA
jgi:hypothetical protein